MTGLIPLLLKPAISRPELDPRNLFAVAISVKANAKIT